MQFWFIATPNSKLSESTEQTFIFQHVSLQPVKETMYSLVPMQSGLKIVNLVDCQTQTSVI